MTAISEETRGRIAQAWPGILAALAAGDLIRDALARVDVSRGEINAYKQGNAALQAQWENAREASADSFMDEAMSVARGELRAVLDDKGQPIMGADGKPLVVRPDSQHARNLIDTLKWATRVRNPRLYGDKAQLDVNVRTVDLTRIIEAANARLAESRVKVIEHNSGAEIGLARALLPRTIGRLSELV